MTVTTAFVTGLSSTEAYFITPDGILVGASLSGTGLADAVWQNGLTSYTEAYLAGDAHGSIYAVNDAGMATGYTTTNATSYTVSHGLAWQNGTPATLGSLGSGVAVGQAVNDSGEVVGYSAVAGSDGLRPFAWQGGVMTALASIAVAAGTAANDQTATGDAVAINNSGLIVGNSAVITAGGGWTVDATLWKNGQTIDLGTLAGGGGSYANAINNSGTIVGFANSSSSPANSVIKAVIFQNGGVTALGGLAANQSSEAIGINESGTIVGEAAIADGTDHAVMWQNGVITDLNSLLASNSGWILQSASGIDANGDIFGSGRLNGVYQQFLLTPGAASSSVTVDTSTANLTINGTATEPTTVNFSGAASEYSISVSGSTVIVTDAGTGRTSTDHLTNVTAIHFSDLTDIVAATPGANTVTTGNITEIYAAVFGRLPDVGGLVFYQNNLAGNPATPLVQYAEYFLASPEYTGAHSYSQSNAGDDAFITDSYQNLLHRMPNSTEISYYEKVIDGYTQGLTPGTSAYAAAQTVGHAWLLTYFSASSEFLGDVQVTAQTPSSAQHWLILH